MNVCVCVRERENDWCVKDSHGSYGSLIVLNLHFTIFKALKVLNLSARSLKVLNFIFVKSSLNIKVMVVFITTCHTFFMCSLLM